MAAHQEVQCICVHLLYYVEGEYKHIYIVRQSRFFLLSEKSLPQAMEAIVLWGIMAALLVLILICSCVRFSYQIKFLSICLNLENSSSSERCSNTRAERRMWLSGKKATRRKMRTISQTRAGEQGALIIIPDLFVLIKCTCPQELAGLATFNRAVKWYPPQTGFGCDKSKSNQLLHSHTVFIVNLLYCQNVDTVMSHQ